MAKYTTQNLSKIADWVAKNGLIDYGGATLTSFINEFGIDDMTYYRWMRKTEFAEMIEKAKAQYKANLSVKLVDSLARAAQGYEAETTRTEYVSDREGKPVISKQIKERKPVPPNVGAAIFLLTNLSTEWKNRQTNEITGKDGGELFSQPVTIRIHEAGAGDTDAGEETQE